MRQTIEVIFGGTFLNMWEMKCICSKVVLLFRVAQKDDRRSGMRSCAGRQAHFLVEESAETLDCWMVKERGRLNVHARLFTQR